MPTTYEFFSGPVRYSNTVTPDTKFNKDGVFSLEIVLDDDQIQKLKATGSGLTVRESDGQKFVKFKREAKRVIKGQTVEFGPPPTEYEGAPHETFIPRGSDVTMKVAFFDAGQKVAHRIMAIRVDRMEPYVPQEEQSSFSDFPDAPDVPAFGDFPPNEAPKEASKAASAKPW